MTYEDLLNEAYSATYHTGKTCICESCNEPAGTKFSKFLCATHDKERQERSFRNALIVSFS